MNIFIITIITTVAFVLISRLFGAWMLRINEIISGQKTIIDELKIMNMTPRQREEYNNVCEELAKVEKIQAVKAKKTERQIFIIITIVSLIIFTFIAVNLAIKHIS